MARTSKVMSGVADVSELRELAEGHWLRSAPHEPLFARWPARKAAPFWKRLVGGGPARDDSPVGELECRSEGLTLTNSDGARLSALLWEAPFVIQLSHWPYEDDSDTSELNLSLRASAPGGDVVGLRFVWPTSALPGGLPRKQEMSPFVSPALLLRLWPWLARCAELHDTHSPAGPSLDVSPERLASLVSQNEVETCVACDSQGVQLIAHQVYRCLRCGYEGGQGLADFMRQKRVTAISRLSPEERRRSTREDLKEAVRLLKLAQLKFIALTRLGEESTFEALTSSTKERREMMKIRNMRAMTIHKYISDAGYCLEDAGFKLPEVVKAHTDLCLARLAPSRAGGPAHIMRHHAEGVAMLSEVIAGVRRAMSASA